MLLYVFDMFHILLSGDSLRDLWNAYMYVCVYVYMCVCVYVCMYVYVCVCVCVCMCICVCVCVYVCVYVCTYMCVCVCVCMCVCMYVCMYACICVCMYVCMCNNIFKIQKRIIRILANKGRRNSCRNLYKQLQILTLPSQYIFSLLIFVVRYRDLFLFNSEIHDINTHFNYNLHLPTTNLTLVQKVVLYSGSQIYNNLPSHIKRISNDFKQFKTKLKAYLLENSCYSLEEFYQMTSDQHK